MIFGVMGITAKVNAQCTVSNLAVQDVFLNTGTCRVTFSISFDQEVNIGNKFAYIHLWTSTAYHTPAPNWVNMYSNPAAAPQAADLVNVLGTISIQFNGTSTPSLMSSYLPDPTAPTLTSGLTISKVILPGGTVERETISGFNLPLPSPCTGVVALKGDIWASQASNGKNVHCATQGLTFNLNNPQILSAFKICNPRRLVGTIKNNGVTSQNIQYMVYKDNGDNLFSSVLDGPAVYTSGSISIAAGATQGFSLSSADIAGLGVVGENSNYWVEVITVPASGFSTVAYILNSSAACAPLPIGLSSFSASRNLDAVMLRWTTSFEQNNTGFDIERNVNGNWEKIGFVSSLALNGNSSSDLSYSFVDRSNTSKGISQYRLRQVDMDAKATYSDVRAVRGEGQIGKITIYPNPTADGKVNILFDDANVVRTVSISDMSGRMVKEVRAISNNNITIMNLQPGMYTVKITVPETGEQAVQKIVVNKR